MKRVLVATGMGAIEKVVAVALLALLGVTPSPASGQTPAQLGGACMMGNVEGVKKLLAAGVDANGKFNLGAARGVTPLRFACIFDMGPAEDRVEIVRLLLAAGARADEVNKGMSLLHHAVMYGGHPAIIEPLVAEGLDIDAKNKRGRTALHGASLLGKTDWAEALIKNGADVNARSDTGETPLDLAVSHDKEEVAEALRRHGGLLGVVQAPLLPQETVASPAQVEEPAESKAFPIRIDKPPSELSAEIIYSEMDASASHRVLPLSVQCCGESLSSASVVEVNGTKIEEIHLSIGPRTEAGSCETAKATLALGAIAQHLTAGRNRFMVRAGELTAEVVLEIE